MHAGDMLLSNPPATAGVAGVTSVNTRTGVVTLVPSDVNITAAVDKGVVYMDGTHYANSAAFTWDKTTHTLTLGGGVDGTLTLGSTPFVFKDLGGGVCQIADPNLLWNVADVAINSPAPNFTIQNTGNAAGALLQLNQDGSWSISSGAGVLIANAAAANLEIQGAAAVDASQASVVFSDPSQATSSLTVAVGGVTAISLQPASTGSLTYLHGGVAGGNGFEVAADGSITLSGHVANLLLDGSTGEVALSNNGGRWDMDATTGALFPPSSGTLDIGKTAASGRVGTVFASMVDTPQIVGAAIATPSAPASAHGTTYFKTIGGKVKFVALFPTGAEQVIASEP